MHEPETKKEFGQRLRAARDQCGLTQEEASSRLGITKAALSAWEVGRNIPDALMLGHVARIYETSTDTLLGHGTSPDQHLIDAMRAALKEAGAPNVYVRRMDARRERPEERNSVGAVGKRLRSAQPKFGRRKHDAKKG